VFVIEKHFESSIYDVNLGTNLRINFLCYSFVLNMLNMTTSSEGGDSNSNEL